MYNLTFEKLTSKCQIEFIQLISACNFGNIVSDGLRYLLYFLLYWMGFIAITPNTYNVSLIHCHTSNVDFMKIRYSSSLPCFVKVFIITLRYHLIFPIFRAQTVHFHAQNKLVRIHIVLRNNQNIFFRFPRQQQ